MWTAWHKVGGAGGVRERAHTNRYEKEPHGKWAKAKETRQETFRQYYTYVVCVCVSVYEEDCSVGDI